MTAIKDPEVFDNAYRFYKAGQYQQSYDLLTAAIGDLPAHKHQLFLWRICMAALLGRPELAEEILSTALDNGYFFGEGSLRRDSDLQTLQGRQEFEKLMAHNLVMLSAAQEAAKPGLTLLEPVDVQFQKAPFLMALHGNNSTADLFRGYWSTLSEEGWLVAIPQSSQVSGNNIFCWNDQTRAKKEIIDHYTAVSNKISVDPAKTVIAGFSMGGYTAVRAALEQHFPIRGVLGIAPYIGDLSVMERILDASPADKLRAYFLLGEEDSGCTPNALLFQKSLKRHRVPCEVEIFPKVGHDFPEEYRAAIERGLHFILQE